MDTGMQSWMDWANIEYSDRIVSGLKPVVGTTNWNKNISYRKETVWPLHNIEIKVLY